MAIKLMTTAELSPLPKHASNPYYHEKTMKNRVEAKALRKNTEKKLKKKAMRRWKKWKAAGEEKEKEEGEEGDWQVGSFEQLQQRFAEWDQFNWKVRTPPAAEAETPQKEELKERQDKLRLLKGRPVTLKKFLEEVVLPKCKLCPPHSKCKQRTC